MGKFKEHFVELMGLTEGDKWGAVMKRCVIEVDEVRSLVSNMLERDRYYMEPIKIEDLKYIEEKLEEIVRNFR